MKKAILIYNPMSGDHSADKQLDYIIRRFQEKNILLQPYRIFSNETEILEDVLKHGDYECALVSGGDGTLNYSINALLKNNINIPVGVIPSGTSNDFARCINMPHDISKCMDVILAGNTIDVDVGLINNNHYFLTTCAGGIFVDVSFNTHNELKKNFGTFAYYLKAISEVTNIRSFPVTVETESQTLQEEILLFIILNGKHAAGFTNLLDVADYSDGMMDLIILKNCSHLDMATVFFNVLSGTYINNKNVISLKARSCTIKGDSSINLSVDGEKGDALPIEVRFINKALKVFAR